jgi:hypothetical protein
VEKAYETLVMMPKKGVAPDVIHLNVVLGACVKALDVDKIVAITDIIGQLAKPDLATYTSLMFLNSRLQVFPLQ